MASDAFCRSMSTTPRLAAPSRCCCELARRRLALRLRAIFAGSYGVSVAIGPTPTSPCGATAITVDPNRCWCEENDVDYVFGLPGNTALHADPVIITEADACATDRATRGLVELRRYVETRYAAKSWGKNKRRVVARIEASPLGLDVRFVVTSLTRGSAEYIYDTLYCARGQAENLIKLHKSQLKSDRTSCRSANANQMRIILHTAAYWLMWAVRQAMPATNPLRNAEFSTVRLRLLKVAARVVETASRIRIAFATGCPDAALFRSISLTLRTAGP